MEERIYKKLEVDMEYYLLKKNMALRSPKKIKPKNGFFFFKY